MVNANKRASNDKYNAKCDYISIRPIRAEGARIRAAARDAGQSLQGYILQACAERMQRDGVIVHGAVDDDAADWLDTAPITRKARMIRQKCETIEEARETVADLLKRW